MSFKNWNKTSKVAPPEGIVVETKIDDDNGVRNYQKLMRLGNLWFGPSGQMYVYYTPTHWRFRD